jgi:hypothetical protein
MLDDAAVHDPPQVDGALSANALPAKNVGNANDAVRAKDLKVNFMLPPKS